MNAQQCLICNGAGHNFLKECPHCDGTGIVKPDTKKYHVHVYRISHKYEVDIDAVSPGAARSEAIRIVKTKSTSPVELDCDLMALEFEVKSKVDNFK